MQYNVHSMCVSPNTLILDSATLPQVISTAALPDQIGRIPQPPHPPPYHAEQPSHLSVSLTARTGTFGKSAVSPNSTSRAMHLGHSFGAQSSLLQSYGCTECGTPAYGSTTAAREAIATATATLSISNASVGSLVDDIDSLVVVPTPYFPEAVQESYWAQRSREMAHLAATTPDNDDDTVDVLNAPRQQQPGMGPESVGIQDRSHRLESGVERQQKPLPQRRNAAALLALRAMVSSGSAVQVSSR